MSIKLGSTSFSGIYLGSTKIGAAYLGSTKVYVSSDPYKPLGLPSYTIRLQFDNSSIDPTTLGITSGSWVQVSSNPNVWDFTKTRSPSSWSSLFRNKLKYNTVGYFSVLGANLTSVTNMSSMLCGCSGLQQVPLFDTSSATTMDSMFSGCTALQQVPLFNTSSVTSMSSMFSGCTALQQVPLFNTSSVTNMTNMFYNCWDVESGALALYQQASTQTTPPSNHSDTFYNCGILTTSGTAELVQIPSSWGGIGT